MIININEYIKWLKKCFFCKKQQVIKKGKRNGLTRYFCKNCRKSFTNKRKPQRLTNKIFNEYFYGKQTLKQLSNHYKKSVNWVKEQIDNYEIKKRKRNPRKVIVIGDATFLGKRKYRNQKGVLVFRDNLAKENLIWKHLHTEKAEDYLQLKLFLEKKGYQIQAVVIDGKQGVASVFKDMPVQLCQFHQVKTITTKLTRKPKLEASIELRKLSLILTNTTEDVFKKELSCWYEKWKDFLNEKTLNTETSRQYFTHKRLRSAYRSLNRNLPYLFTYQKYPKLNIPNTTNSLDGGVFSHMKKLLKNHNGLRNELREKLVNDYLNRQD